LKRDSGPGFEFTGWNQSGNELVYSIDVLEPGSYEVELNYTAKPEGMGALFEVYTEHDSSTALIENTQVAVSAPLQLPAGVQRLHVRLKELSDSGESIDWMEMLTVRRLRDPATSMLRDPGFAIWEEAQQENRMVAKHRSETREFMKKTSEKVFHTQVGNRLRLKPMGENLDALERIQVYSGFTKIVDTREVDTPLIVSFPEAGRHTINVELIHSGGVSDSARIDCMVENPAN